MMQHRDLFRKAALKRFLSGVLAAATLCGLTATGALAAESKQDGAKLTYTVAEGLDFGDTSVFATSEEAWKYADTIVSHVDDTMADLESIWSKNVVDITDEPYNAEPHAKFELVEGTYKKSEADAAEEIRLAEKNTRAIYQAICDVSEAGGGTVVVPAVEGQVFYTAAIHLEDNVKLHIEKGATLAFTTDYASYAGELMEELYGSKLTLTRFESVELMNFSPFIYAYGKKNIAITGEGTLDGQASTGDETHPETMTWHEWKKKRDWTMPDGQIKSIEAQDAPRTKLFAQGQTDVPVAERTYGYSEQPGYSGADDGFLRPNFIQPYNCQNVLIQDVNVVNSPMWEINPVLCDTVLVQGVSVSSHMHNNDGCDPEATSNMVIRNSTFDVGDDCIAIKSGRNGDGLRIGRASFNIVIENNDMADGHGGVTIGSEITSGVKNIFSRNNQMESNDLECAYRFKTNYIRGGVIENIYYQNDTVKMVKDSKPVILVDLNYDISKEVDMMKSMEVAYNAYVPQFKHVLFEGLTVNEANVAGNGGKYALQLNGFPVSGIDESATVAEGLTDCYITDFTIRDASFTGSQQAFNMNYVDGLTLENVTITGTTVADSVSNCKDLTFTGCDFTGSAVAKSTFESLDGTVLTDTTFPEAPAFTDVAAGTWYYDAVQYVSDKGLMSGTAAGIFQPDGKLSRAMVAQTLYNLEGKPAVSESAGFPDVEEGAWYAAAVDWAASAKVVSGYGDGRFGGSDDVTREQLVAILYRYAQYKGYDVTAAGDLTAFGDGESVSSWASEAMSWGVGAGVISGKGGSSLDPQGTATRAEMAKILMVFCDTIVK